MSKTNYTFLKTITLGMMLIVGANQLSAQSVNNGIFFQAVARDNFSNPAKERKIYVQSNVIQTSTNGPSLLVEQFQVNTDGNGMFSISIGNGTRVGGTASGLNAIDWSQGPFYLNLKIAITPAAGNVGWDYTKEWVNIGTTSFGAVPYALYSANAGGVNQKLSITDTTKMLAVYAKSQAVQALSTTVETKLSAKDTLLMLAPYAKAAYVLDSAYIKSELQSKVSSADSTKSYITPTSLTTAINSTVNAGNLIGTSLNSAIIGSNLTSVGTLGNLTVTNPIVGSITGNAATATIATNATTANTAVNITATSNSTLTTLPNLTSVGTITTGIWSGTAVAVTNGGTGLTSAGTNGQFLTSTASGTLTWTSSSSIPYTGATGAVNLGTYDLKVYGLTVGRGTGSVSSNTAIGASALLRNTTGNSNTASGYNSLVNNTTGYLNTANGSGALFSNITGYSNTAIGYNVLGSNTTGNSNTAIGESALYKNTTANFLTAVGTHSLYSNTTGYNNTAIGFYSLRENTTGGANTANGSWTLRWNTAGTGNTASGSSSLQNNTTGNNNTGTGESALFSNTTGYQNTANGAGALRANTTGYNNTATGSYALFSNTTAVSNNAFGANTLYSNTTGYSNNAFGFQSLYTNTIGSANTGYGQSTLYLNTTGSNNTAIGYSSLDNNTTGSNNTAIGYDADVSSNNLSNATAIGNGAIVNASNTIQLGNTSVTNVKTSGTITAGGLGLGINSPNTSAILDASSTTQGFLPPRMTYAQRNLISNPANGLMIFCSDCGLYGEPQFYDGNNNWRKLDISLGSGTGTLNLVVDNLNAPTNGTGNTSVGQSFTTTSNQGRLIKIVTSAIGGVTGTQLTNGIANSYLRIRSYVNDNEIISPNALSGEILATSNTNPTILNYDYAAYWPTVEFTFPNTIVLQANTKYVIQFVAGSGVYNYVKITGTYSGGQAYDLSGTNSSYVRDFPFQLYLQQF